jgi:hypothetical protein
MKFFANLKSTISLMGLPKEQRRIVFYSEGKAYWPHLNQLLMAFLDKTKTPTCFLTSDMNDPIWGIQHPMLKVFRTDLGFVRDYLFKNIDTDVLVMTMPDLDQYQIKRSVHPVHYVYVQHSLLSLHTVYRKGAFDHFDTLFCGGPHHDIEARALEAEYDLPAKTLVPHGYERLDSIINARKPFVPNSPRHVLVAPSWGETAVIESCGRAVVQSLLDGGYQVTVRPHPETIKHARSVLDELKSVFGADHRFNLDLGVAGQDSLHASDVMISDWSGAALDYAFGLGKPVVFIDVPRKINNPEHDRIVIEPIEVFIREQVGNVCPEDKIFELPNYIEDVFKRLGTNNMKKIDKVAQKYCYNLGKSAGPGSDYLIELLGNQANEKS